MASAPGVVLLEANDVFNTVDCRLAIQLVR